MSRQPDAYRIGARTFYLSDNGTYRGGQVPSVMAAVLAEEGLIGAGATPLWLTETEPIPAEPTNLGAVVEADGVLFVRVWSDNECLAWCAGGTGIEDAPLYGWPYIVEQGTLIVLHDGWDGAR